MVVTLWILAILCIPLAVEAGTIPAIHCPVLNATKNGKIELEGTSYGKTATTVCDEGFIISDQQAATQRCQSDNTWDGKAVICIAVLCPKLPIPPNGKLRQQDRGYKATATTVCDEGYEATDPTATIRYCQGDNRWGGEAVNCTRKNCPTLQTAYAGILSAQNGSYGDKITLHCDSGRTLDGINTVTCKSDGQWDAPIGKCILEANYSRFFLIAMLFAVGITVILAITILWKGRQKKRRQEGQVEMQELLPDLETDFTFVLAKEMSTALSSEKEYKHFISILEEAIKEAINGLKIHGLDILYVCQNTRRGFLRIMSADVDLRLLADAISKAVIEDNNIIAASIKTIDKVQSALSAQILQEKHQRDDESQDDKVDFKTQYVKLKLQSHATIGTMTREDIERPDYYQERLKQQGGTDIEDEDLIKGNEFGKYILLRGRAGIGKSTLMQRLLWKWANGEWATQFKAIFLLNLRYLMTLTKDVDFPNLLNTYSVYNTGRTAFIADHKWLRENVMKTAFVLDGVDEVRDFKKFWEQNEGLSDTSTPMKTSKPIQWCFALMRREMLANSTIIVSSRPFADLGYIARTLRDRSLHSSLQLAQLMGLTRERVHEFVNKNVQEGRKDFVRQTLEKNPILMSISSITFYCAALCKILDSQADALTTKLITYTQITAYIMDRFMRRSLKKETLDLQQVLQFLSELAFNGLVNEIGKGPIRLVFGSKDFEQVSTENHLMSAMVKSGLLVQTQILDHEDREKCTVLSQFVHLMIQEFLAMVGLLSQAPEKFKQLLTQFSRTQQYSMAILFLYGLAFNKDNEMVKNLDVSTSGEKEKQDSLAEKQDTLKEFAMNMPNTLQALQVAHESQSAKVAKAVGETTFKDGCRIENTKLTVIDIMALIFVLQHNPAIHKVSLERAELDEIAVRELAKFLLGENHVDNICLVDDTLDDVCVKELMATLLKSDALRKFELSSNLVTDTGIRSVAEALAANTSLETLSLLSSTVKDEGIQHLAKSLQKNKTLKSLRLMFRGMTDVGLQHLLDSIAQNKTLNELWIIRPDITDSGLTALGQTLLVNSSITSIRVDCGAMSDEGVIQIADTLKEQGSLRKLWLHSCKITDRGVTYLMDKVKGQKTLTDITLLGFYMKKDGVKAILNTLPFVPTLLVRMKKPDVTSQLLHKVQDNPMIKLT